MIQQKCLPSTLKGIRINSKNDTFPDPFGLQHNIRTVGAHFLCAIQWIYYAWDFLPEGQMVDAVGEVVS